MFSNIQVLPNIEPETHNLISTMKTRKGDKLHRRTRGKVQARTKYVFVRNETFVLIAYAVQYLPQSWM